MKKHLIDIIVSLVIGLVVVVGLFLTASMFSSISNATDFKLVELDELNLDYKNFAMLNPEARNPLLYPEHPKESININLNINLFSYLGFDNSIETYTTSSQYRSIGLQTSLYVRLTDYVNFGYYHHSQHLIDRDHAFMDRYPVEDALQLKIILFKNRNQRDYLF